MFYGTVFKPFFMSVVVCIHRIPPEKNKCSRKQCLRADIPTQHHLGRYFVFLNDFINEIHLRTKTA